MAEIQAVLARYVETIAPGIRGPVPVHKLAFGKIINSRLVIPDDEPLPDSVADWCARAGYIAAGAVVGVDESPAVFWIRSDLYVSGRRPEDFAAAVGESVASATVAFYRSDSRRPAHLATSMSKARVRAIRRRNPVVADDVSISKRDNARINEVMLGYRAYQTRQSPSVGGMSRAEDPVGFDADPGL